MGHVRVQVPEARWKRTSGVPPALNRLVGSYPALRAGLNLFACLRHALAETTNLEFTS